MPHPLMSRRNVILAAVAIGGGGVWYAKRLPFEGQRITPIEAHARARAGEITLVDIRSPREWAATGVGEGAWAIDLRDDDFVAKLESLVDHDRAAPVALICASGVRSNRTSQRLLDAGFTNIIDVPEGMLGSTAGPGWLARDLPTESVQR